MTPVLLAPFGPIGAPELIIILVVVIIIFGVGRLPEVGGAIGKGIREFRRATKEPEERPQLPEAEARSDVEPPVSKAPPAAPPAAPPTAPSTAPSTGQSMRYCPQCGASTVAGAKFCVECGASLQAPVN
jgi:sec-independent protein translocase protein TatA